MSGMIEAWGRGFDKIKAGCEIYAGPLPDPKIEEIEGETVKIKYNKKKPYLFKVSE